MGAHLLKLLFIVLLTLPVITPAAGRELCLNCHPAHFTGLGACTSCHRGNPSSDRKNIAHDRIIAGRYARFTLGETAEVRTGMGLIGQYACRRCHVVAGRGNRLAANLDFAAARKAPPELAKAILQPAEGMPDFRPSEQGQTAIINALLGAASARKPDNAVQPQVVHFSRSAGAGRDIFSRKCGQCHRILSLRHGALGRGDIGPNLSGLLSPFHPRTFRTAERWTEAGLGDWLKNPRRTRPWALMQPVALTRAEAAELTTIMLHADGASF